MLGGLGLRAGEQQRIVVWCKKFAKSIPDSVERMAALVFIPSLSTSAEFRAARIESPD